MKCKIFGREIEITDCLIAEVSDKRGTITPLRVVRKKIIHLTKSGRCQVYNFDTKRYEKDDCIYLVEVAK